MNLVKLQDTKLIHKLLAFFYTDNEKSERKIKESIPFTIETKIIKYLKINLTKEKKELYTENYKTMMKEIKDYINKRRDFPCSLLKESILQNQSTDLMQSISNYQ